MSKTARIDSTLRWGFRVIGLIVLALVALVVIGLIVAFVGPLLNG